jgi:hypothetical protein
MYFNYFNSQYFILFKFHYLFRRRRPLLPSQSQPNVFQPLAYYSLWGEFHLTSLLRIGLANGLHPSEFPNEFLSDFPASPKRRLRAI